LHSHTWVLNFHFQITLFHHPRRCNKTSLVFGTKRLGFIFEKSRTPTLVQVALVIMCQWFFTCGKKQLQWNYNMALVRYDKMLVVYTP
jgi:hypothetical protein